jgi:serine protease Do
MLSGAYLDRYEIEVLPGQRIIADLRSEEFDTFLRVLDPMGVGDENDDYGLEQSHSHVEKLALVEGTYVIEVTSFDPYSTGAYRLQIAVVE